MTQLYDSDEDDSFKDNFYNLFHNVQTHLTNVSRDNEIKSIVETKLLVNRKLIDNIIESFPSKINVNVLNELLHKNGVLLTKEEFLTMCYFIKGEDVVELNAVSTRELKTFIENNKPNN